MKIRDLILSEIRILREEGPYDQTAPARPYAWEFDPQTDPMGQLMKTTPGATQQRTPEQQQTAAQIAQPPSATSFSAQQMAQPGWEPPASFTATAPRETQLRSQIAAMQQELDALSGQQAPQQPQQQTQTTYGGPQPQTHPDWQQPQGQPQTTTATVPGYPREHKNSEGPSLREVIKSIIEKQRRGQ